MNRKVISNFFYQAIYQLVIIILPIVTVPIVSRSLLPKGVGTFNFVTSVVNYFVLVAALGLANYAVREISVVRSDKKKLSQKFWEIQTFNFIFSAIIVVIYLVFCFFTKYKTLFLIQSLTVISVIFDISWFFQGIEDFKKVTLVNIFVKVLSFLGIIVLVNSPSDLTIYTLINSLSTLFSSLVFWIFVRKYISFVKVTLHQAMQHFLPALNFFLLKLSSTIFINFNKTLLGILVSMSAVGLFSNSLTLVTIIGSLINTMNVVLLPRMSLLESQKKEEVLMNTLDTVIHLQLFLTVALMFGLIATADKMVPWFLGEHFLSTIGMIKLLSPIVILQSLHQGIANQYLVPKNQMRSYNITMIIGTVVSVLTGIILIPNIGVYGAIIGFLSGQITLAFARSYILVKHTVFHFHSLKILGYFISGILMYFSIFIFTSSLHANIVTNLLQIIIGIIVYMLSTTIMQINPIFDIWNQHNTKK
ncbi:oligosaccharide flippase family protein [Lapidilactobacillus dextrinicus]|uniref:oligosaccharide flippase family protein n=1 Tax=Lapidilactobacillus dextrinicus TaxID=51664 RepID=UPI003F282D95